MVTTATFTDLLRHPKDVAERTGRGAVRITRRDADDLILMRAGDLDAHDEGIALASRLMRATLRNRGDVRTAVEDVFPWCEILDENERTAFATAIEPILWAAGELGEYTKLRQVVQSWEGTAEAYAAGMPPGDGSDLDWYTDEFPVVERP